jgi:Arc/MetJ-type ribon-helix-helix transcriptional regulator
MKLSVSLPDEVVEFLDEYARKVGATRSAAVQEAVRLLRTSRMGGAYASAWDEWADSDDAVVWEETAADGMGS